MNLVEITAERLSLLVINLQTCISSQRDYFVS